MLVLGIRMRTVTRDEKAACSVVLAPVLKTNYDLNLKT
jgi:hypothetical protein